MEKTSSAIVRLMYCLFNHDYIVAHGNYAKAAARKSYADDWLYLCLACASQYSLRMMRAIPHPKLTDTPKAVLQKVLIGEYDDEDAVYVLHSITDQSMPSGDTRCNLFVPNEMSVHFGKLFSCAEAHCQLAGMGHRPLIRHSVATRDLSSRMGDEIGRLAQSSGFRVSLARMAYLEYLAQQRQMERREVDENDLTSVCEEIGSER